MSLFLEFLGSWFHTLLAVLCDMVHSPHRHARLIENNVLPPSDADRNLDCYLLTISEMWIIQDSQKAKEPGNGSGFRLDKRQNKAVSPHDWCVRLIKSQTLGRVRRWRCWCYSQSLIDHFQLLRRLTNKPQTILTHLLLLLPKSKIHNTNTT